MTATKARGAAEYAATEAQIAEGEAAGLVFGQRTRPTWCLAGFQGTCDNHDEGSSINLCEDRAWGEDHICSMDGRNRHLIGKALMVEEC